MKHLKKLCLDNPALLQDRGRLISLSREKLHNDGFTYAKKKSRSKVFGSSGVESGEVAAKKPRWSQELRSKRISQILEDIEEVEKRTKFIERSREKYANVQQYEHAAEKCKEIAKLRAEKRNLQSELDELKKLEVKSKRYFKAQATKSSEGQLGEEASGPKQTQLLSFFKGHKETVSTPEGNNDPTPDNDSFLLEGQPKHNRKKN